MEQQGEHEDPQSPPVASASHSSISPFPLTPHLPNHRHEICAPEKELPSLAIAQLWQKPLIKKVSKSSSPRDERSKRIRNQGTPSRKNSSLPPMKLSFRESEESPGLVVSRSAYRRSLSHPEHGLYGSDAPSANPKRLKLFVEETSPYEEFSGGQPKTETRGASSSTTLTPAVKKLFVKSQSDSQLPPPTCNVITAVEKRESNPNLIGDGSKVHILPVKVNGEHPDLKEITGETLASLLDKKEDFNPGVTFKIIDCRYPYEYNGGHIRGAVNCFTKQQIKEQLLDCKTILKLPSGKSGGPGGETGVVREILIFHCEFSSKRGPRLCRYLRDIDRSSNISSYPFLFYPELYVLFGGYKAFFEKFSNLCDGAYIPMDHPDHAHGLKRYKSEEKKVKSRQF